MGNSSQIEYLISDEKLLFNLDNVEDLLPKLMEYYLRAPDMKDYTPHGKYHTIRVIEILNRFFEEFYFSDEEKYLLYIAAWVHDLGCIERREGHAKKSASFIIRLSTTFDVLVGPEATMLLPYIVGGHSKDSDITGLPNTMRLFKDDDIRLKFITAIFRLADGCDITKRRTPAILYEILKSTLGDDGIRYWEAHLNTLNIKIASGQIIVSVDIKEKADLIVEELKKDLESVNEILMEHGVEFTVETKEVPNMAD